MSEGPIVVGYDGSEPSARALRWAAARAARLGAPLTVLTVEARRLGRPAAAVLERGIELAREEHAEPTGTVLDGPVASALVDLSRHAHLVVIGTDRSSETIGPVFGALPLKVVAGAACPVAVVPRSDEVRRSGVVCGYDNDAIGERALALAATEAAALRTSLRVIHAWSGPSVLPAGPEAPADDGRPARLVERDRIEAALVRLHGLTKGLEISPEVRHGEPAMVLTHQARHAELLVVGSHGKQALDSFLLGSVSHDVLTNITCPVIVVPALASDALQPEDELVGVG